MSPDSPSRSSPVTRPQAEELPSLPNEVSAPSGGAPGSETRALEELSRLNNELANLHRELARKHAVLEATNTQLTHALASVKELRGLLPICGECRKVRDDQDYWHTLESYLSSHSNARFSHGLCPDCEARFSREIDQLGPGVQASQLVNRNLLPMVGPEQQFPESEDGLRSLVAIAPMSSFQSTAADLAQHRQLQEQVHQARKMKAIGQLAGGVAHEFNNILATTLMQLGGLQQSPDLPVAVRDALKEIEGETLRAANLTRQLLLFSRRQAARVEPLELNALIHEFLNLLRHLLGANIEAVFQSSPAPVWVNADAGMLEEVVMNLCANARDAMPRGGRLTLATTLLLRDAESPVSHPEARPRHFVRLTVADTGCGMDESVVNRLFEPFFTTKEVGKGTGLGLATVYGIIKQHEGWVEVESALGKGTSFSVYFPVAPNPAEQASTTGPTKAAPGGGETILLVEDDPALQRTAGLCLRKLGYNVLSASDATQALKLWEQHEHDIGLLLTDMVMPGEMTGLDLAKRLREKKTDLKAIISSGYSLELAQEPFTCLAKPYKAATLARVVRQALDEHPLAAKPPHPGS